MVIHEEMGNTKKVQIPNWYLIGPETSQYSCEITSWHQVFEIKSVVKQKL
jgi:hypothetical protein